VARYRGPVSDESDDSSRLCQWCSTPAADGLTHCANCGAALTLRETIGEVVIPGVTHVDPALAQFANEPLRIPRASPSQSVAAGTVSAAALAGGPAGVIALAALGAVAANEYGSAARGRKLTPEEIEKIGQPSEAALQMLKLLEEQEKGGEGP